MMVFENNTWTIRQIHEIANHIVEIGVEEMGLNPYSSQIEIVTAEQMIDVHGSFGLPILYNDWRFGKSFQNLYKSYLGGHSSLAYETVINTSPSIIYCMEDNSAALQSLVIAHAGVGHSHVFRNNYLLADSGAESILDYAEFARNFVRTCEDRYGRGRVGGIMDAAHSLMWSSMSTPRKGFDIKKEAARQADRLRRIREDYRDIWNTIPVHGEKMDQFDSEDVDAPGADIILPESNLLYFIEKHSPVLRGWERELCRIVRTLAQFFEPMTQVSVVHESAAVWCHMHIMNRLFEKGLIPEGFLIECANVTASVIYQESYRHWRHGWNIYALGYKIAQEIERICLSPTDEDKEFARDWAGNGDVFGTLRWAWNEFRDESFLRQFLTPKAMRDFGMFMICDDSNEYYTVTAIQNEYGYDKMRHTLAEQYAPYNKIPDISVADYRFDDDRTLVLSYHPRPSYDLKNPDAKVIMDFYLPDVLWGFPVEMRVDGNY